MNDFGELVVRVVPSENLKRATGVFLCDGVPISRSLSDKPDNVLTTRKNSMCGLCGIKFPAGTFTCVDCKWYRHKHKGHRPKEKEISLPYNKELQGRLWEARVEPRRLPPTVGRDIYGPDGTQYNTEHSVSTCSETQSLREYFDPPVAADNIVNNPTYAGSLALFGGVRRASSPNHTQRSKQQNKESTVTQDRLLSLSSSTPRRFSAKKLNKSRVEYLREERAKQLELDAKNAQFLASVKQKQRQEKLARQSAEVQAAARRKAEGEIDPMFLRFLRGDVSDPKGHSKSNRENALAEGVHSLWLPGHAAMAKIQSHVDAKAEDVRYLKELDKWEEQQRRSDARVRHLQECLATKQHLMELEEARIKAGLGPKLLDNPYADLKYNAELWDDEEEEETEEEKVEKKTDSCTGSRSGKRTGSRGRGVGTAGGSGFGSLPGSRTSSRPGSRLGGTISSTYGSRRDFRLGISPPGSRPVSRGLSPGSRPGTGGSMGGGLDTAAMYMPEKLRPMNRRQDSPHHLRPFRTVSPEMHVIGTFVRSPSPTSITPSAHQMLRQVA